MRAAFSESMPLKIVTDDDNGRVALEGALDIRTLVEAKRALHEWRTRTKFPLLDLGKLNFLDTPGALLVCGLRANGVELTGVRAEHKSLLDLISCLELNPI